MSYVGFYDALVYGASSMAGSVSGFGPAASFLAHFMTDLLYVPGVFAGVYEMEETMECITLAGGADAISQLLFIAASAGIDFLETVFMLVFLPFISGCGHHGKMFGDGSMKAAMTIPESIPVIMYRKDNGNLIDSAESAYNAASGGEEVIGEIYGFLMDAAKKAFSKYCVKVLNIPEVISELIVGFIIGHVILKGIVDPCLVIGHAIKGINLCAGEPVGWKKCYIGGFTILPEAVVGPTSLPITLMLSFNPWWSFLLFGEKSAKRALGTALIKLFFSYGGRGLYRSFLRSRVTSLIWAIAGAFMYLVRSVCIMPLHKDISGADFTLHKIYEALKIINEIRGFFK